MEDKKQTRSRMTAQSKANIVAAKSVFLVPVDGGYTVELTGENGVAPVENATGAIVYKSMQTAKKAVVTHNSTLRPALKPTI